MSAEFFWKPDESDKCPTNEKRRRMRLFVVSLNSSGSSRRSYYVSAS